MKHRFADRRQYGRETAIMRLEIARKEIFDTYGHTGRTALPMLCGANVVPSQSFEIRKS